MKVHAILLAIILVSSTSLADSSCDGLNAEFETYVETFNGLTVQVKELLHSYPPGKPIPLAKLFANPSNEIILSLVADTHYQVIAGGVTLDGRFLRTSMIGSFSEPRVARGYFFRLVSNEASQVSRLRDEILKLRRDQSNIAENKRVEGEWFATCINGMQCVLDRTGTKFSDGKQHFFGPETFKTLLKDGLVDKNGDTVRIEIYRTDFKPVEQLYETIEQKSIKRKIVNGLGAFIVFSISAGGTAATLMLLSD